MYLLFSGEGSTDMGQGTVTKEGFDFGVSMIPRPKSEAWLLCAVGNSYQYCDRLEGESGNDKGQNPLKDQLEEALGEPASRELLAAKVKSREIDIHKIDMPSLKQFKERLDEVLNNLEKSSES